MFEITYKKQLAPTITQISVVAPLVTRNAQPGQFVIIRVSPKGERIPLTIYEAKGDEVTLIYQVVGASTRLLDEFKVGDSLTDVVGPLGEATNLDLGKRVIVVGGGLGCAIAYPLVHKLYLKGTDVTSIIGFRTHDLVILEDEFRISSHHFYLTTDDGSYGEHGRVTDVLRRLLQSDKYDVVYAIGPMIMMKYVALTTKEFQTKTIVSMNSIMVDGTGMCGGCRVRVGGVMKFACVDGPDFDGHLVDFDEAMMRMNAYSAQEAALNQHICHLLSKVSHE